MEVSYSPHQESRIIEAFLFDPIPFDCVEVSAILATGEGPIPCGRLIRQECRYEDYGAGLLDAFSRFGISLNQEVWVDEDDFKNYLTSKVSEYRFCLGSTDQDA